ncbi:MAG: hypothetical protein CR991_00230 [Proteobacteria bacterium]|nr:MAG: hypothetical protein CR991_00230 [Pseudomonadota bacterium]
MAEKRSSFCGVLPPLWWWLLTLLGLALLAYFMIASRQAPVEMDLTERVKQNLLAENIDWVDVNAVNRGRDLQLLGAAPNESLREKAGTIALNTLGVRVVDNLLKTVSTADLALGTAEGNTEASVETEVIEGTQANLAEGLGTEQVSEAAILMTESDMEGDVATDTDNAVTDADAQAGTAEATGMTGEMDTTQADREAGTGDANVAGFTGNKVQSGDVERATSGDKIAADSAVQGENMDVAAEGDANKAQQTGQANAKGDTEQSSASAEVDDESEATQAEQQAASDLQQENTQANTDVANVAVIDQLEVALGDDGSVVLSGAVPSREAVDILIAAAGERVGEKNVVNRLTVTEKGALPVWLEGVDVLLAALPEGQAGLKVIRDKVEVRGLIADAAQGESVMSKVQQALADSGLTVQNRLIISEESPASATEPTSTATDAPPANGTAQAPVSNEPVIVGMDDPQEQAAANCQSGLDGITDSQQIVFAINKAKLRSESLQVLNQIATIMLDCSYVIADRGVLIGGHTDSIGDAAYNQHLSQLRADAVKEYLVGSGVEEKLLETRGYGETKPVAPNTTASGRAKNRRISFEIKQK